MIQKPENIFKKVLSKFEKADLHILVTTFIVGIINNFYFFICDGLQADALSNSFFRVANDWETRLGRPLIQFTDLSRYGFVNQLLIVLVSLAFIAGAIMLIRRTFKIKSNLLLVLLTILIAVSPQFTETYMFLYCADSYLLAFFLSALAVFALSKIKNIKESKPWAILAVLCSGYVCGLYQAYLGVVLGLLIIYTFKSVLIEKKLSNTFKIFVRNMLLVFLGVVIYYVALKVLLKLEHLQLAGYKGADNLGINTILSLPKNILNCFLDFFFFFSNSDRIILNGHYHRWWIYLILLVVSVIGLTLIIRKNKNYKKIPFLLFLLAIFPICINIMNIIASGTRINLVTGPGLITTSLFFVVIYELMQNKKFENIIRWIIVIATLILSWTFVIANTATYVVRQQENDHLKTTLNDVYNKATKIEGFSKDTKWLFSYYFKNNVKDVDKTHGFVTTNDLTWPIYAGVQRYKIFYNRFLGKDITPEDEKNYNHFISSNTFKTMPIYPAEGSIKLIDQTLIIKVSDQTFEVK